jgi:pimeloyl-ACP methyl ester carboxylesterase
VTAGREPVRAGSATSADGTQIAYWSVGDGEGLIVVGGALSTGRSYLPLARLLSAQFEVHVMERRGRPGSGALRPDHSLDAECDDLEAVALATGASAAFGHSFGGLVVLECARQRRVFDSMYAYEPGVPVGGFLRLDWLDTYRTLLARGDRRGAFAVMVRGSGFAPAGLAAMPMWCARGVLRAAVRGKKWNAIEGLLEANLVEHEILRDVHAPSADRWCAIKGRVLLLAGGRSPDFMITGLLPELTRAIPESMSQVLPGLGHDAPRDRPSAVANAVLRHHGKIPPAAADG